LRWLAKWLVIYFTEHPGAAERWLNHAAALCDRDVPKGELDRLLVWAQNVFGQGGTGSDSEGSPRKSAPTRAQPDMEEIYRVAVNGPNRGEFRDLSPERLYKSPERQTNAVLEAWAHYCHQDDPLVCFGADDRFWTRPLSVVKNLLYVHAQLVPSPMRVQRGVTQSGTLSEHSKDGVGERAFIVTEFDFAKLTPKGKPTIWVPLIERCEAQRIAVFDIQAAVLACLARERPLWMAVFSGGKSLQGWFPCRGESEEEVEHWFRQYAKPLGACHSTLCKSQFVRMPDGTRAPDRAGQSVRQTIEYYDPKALAL
jgi:hypothetical protein